MKNKVTLLALLVAGLLAMSTLPAHAMGSGNPYQDAQVGLNYVVYQPSFTAGLTRKLWNAYLWRSQGSSD